MTTFNSLLAATDFSADGNNAVRRAALLAHEHGARLHILHVLPADGCKPLRDWFSPTTDIDLKGAQARAALHRVAVEIAAAYDVRATVEVAVGDPLATLMRASAHADLVVLGQRGHSRLPKPLIGRTADRMLRTCRRPVLVIKKPAEAPYRRVLSPVDFTAGSDRALQLAALLAANAQVHVFHALDTHRDAVLRRADVDESLIRKLGANAAAATGSRMRRLAARLGLDRTHLVFSVGRGAADLATLQQARLLGADLIVAGKQGRSTLGEFLLGSVSSRVLSGAECDMLIVPRPRDAPLPPPMRAWRVAPRPAAAR
ncbi:universal stress protein [Ideonella sp. BN130291]|uniref:universal stress protein n=1 Tax=Ideonella sp. BN130291 TaxID=3112940 RepID=UPI002E26B2ED|nr:universal stress protein [Ideonella sp. BN130291]